MRHSASFVQQARLSPLLVPTFAPFSGQKPTQSRVGQALRWPPECHRHWAVQRGLPHCTCDQMSGHNPCPLSLETLVPASSLHAWHAFKMSHFHHCEREGVAGGAPQEFIPQAVLLTVGMQRGDGQTPLCLNSPPLALLPWLSSLKHACGLQELNV